MKTLFAFAVRELVRNKARVGLIALVLTIQAAALGGGYLAQESLSFTRDFWSSRLHLADLEVEFVPASASELKNALAPSGEDPLEAVRRVPGVRAVSARFVTLAYLEQADGSPLPVVVQYLAPGAHPAVDDIEEKAGRWLVPGKPELAIVDRSFAASHGIKVGASLVLNPYRFPSRFEVAGVGLSAEYLVPTANPAFLVPHKGSLGILYASRESLDRTFPDELYNDIVVTFAEGADRQAATAAVLSVLGSKLEIEHVSTKESTFGHRFLGVMLAGSRSVTPTIALVIALMAAIVAFLSMHRLVAERRREIGCLLAQGFSSREVGVCFFLLGLVPGLVAAALGIPSAILFATKVTRTSAEIAGFPDPIMALRPSCLALGSLSAVFVGVVSAVPPMLAVLRMRPVDALRGVGEVRFVGMPALLERLLAGRTSVRYAVRNVFRRLPLSLATAALVALAVALPAGLLTSIASWETWTKAEAAKLSWDALVSFKVPVSEEHVASLMATKGVAEFRGYVQGYAPVRREGSEVSEMRVRGLPPEDALVAYGLTAGRSFSSDLADEAILNTAFSVADAPRLGEVVTITKAGVVHRLVVVGLVTEASLSTIVVPRGTAQRIFGLHHKLSGAYVRFGAPVVGAVDRAPTAPVVAAPSKAEILETMDVVEDVSPQRSAVPARGRDPKSALADDELVTSVEVRTEYAEATLKYLAGFNVILVPFVGLGAVLAFFFLLSVLGFLLLERETEYASLRALGFDTADIARIVLTEVTVLAGAGLVLSLGTWTATAYALREPMAKTWFSVPLDFRASDFWTCSLPTLAFLLLAAVPGIRALARMDVSAVLRGRAIG